MSDQGAKSEKKKRGARLPFGKLNGIWSELSRTYREQQAGSLESEDAKARVYTLSQMLGVVDRLQEQRVLDTLQAEVVTLREAFAARASGKVVPAQFARTNGAA